MELTPQDKFIVLASDGVWEFISSKEAVDIVAQYESAEEACRQVRKRDHGRVAEVSAALWSQPRIEILTIWNKTCGSAWRGPEDGASSTSKGVASCRHRMICD